MTLSQSTAERIISFVADHTGLCWLSLVLWWGGVMGRRYVPLHRCKNCNYCGKHLEARP